jgi:hypothetical protein
MYLHTRSIRLAACLVLYSLASGTSYAVLTVYDGFDYAANADMNNLNGGTGWGTAVWTGTTATRQIRSPGSNYASLPTVGNKAFIQGSTAGVTRLLPNPLGTTDNTTVWISFIGQRDPTTQVLDRFYSVTFYQGGTASTNERFSIGEQSNNANDLWGVHFTNTAANRQEIAGDSIYTESFLLARVDYHGDTTVNDDVYLWGNYNIASGEPAIATAQAKLVGGFNLAFDRVALRAGAAAAPLPAAQGFFDELRIGTTFSDVTGNGIFCGSGDVNCDGTVDLAHDFEAIRSHFRKSVTLRSDGDLVSNGIVDFADFQQWKTAFLGSGGSLTGVDLNFSETPEPGAAGMLLVAALVFAPLRRRQADGGPARINSQHSYTKDGR